MWIRVFLKIVEIGNIDNTSFTTCKQQNVTRVSIESGTSAIWIWFSPTWAVEPCVTCSCFINSNWIIYIQDWSGVGTKDNLRTSQVARTLMAQGGDLYGWGPRFNIHWDNTLLLEFSFSRSNLSDTNIVIITNFVCLWKTRWHCHIVYLVKHFALKGYCEHCVLGVVYTGDVVNSMCSVFNTGITVNTSSHLRHQTLTVCASSTSRTFACSLKYTRDGLQKRLPGRILFQL